MDRALEVILRSELPMKDAMRAVEFVNRGFGPDMEKALVNIFLRARDEGRQFPDVAALLENAWENAWKHQPLEQRGDPDTPSSDGMRNKQALKNIFGGLGLSQPEDVKKLQL